MKTETKINKLMDILGLSEIKKTIDEHKANLNRPIEIPESEIQSFRAMQGVLYFLQAPELFTYKVCTHCGEEFMVSRRFVKNCSYTCIKKELEAIGINWTRDEDFEALVQSSVYEGQEPIWIRNLESLRRALNVLDSYQGTTQITSAS